MNRALPSTLLVILSVILLAALATHASTMIWPRDVLDVHTYWHAAELLRTDGMGLYDTELLPTGVWPYLYPPAFAALFVPFVLFPTGVGYVLWAGVVVGSVLGSFWLLQRLSGRNGVRMGWIAFALALPVFQLVRMGQVDAVVVVILALALIAARDDRPRLAGSLVGLGAAIKVIPALAVLAFLVVRGWRVAGAALASVAVLSLLPLMWLVPEAGIPGGVERLVQMHVDFVGAVMSRGLGQEVVQEWMLLPWNTSLPGTSLRLTGKAEPGVAAMWMLVLTALWVTHRTRDPNIGVALVVTAGAVGNFVFWTHSVFLFALPLVVAFSLTASGLLVAGFVLAAWVNPVLGTVCYLGVWGKCAADALATAGAVEAHSDDAELPSVDA